MIKTAIAEMEPIESLTLRFHLADGSTLDETVDLDFSDLTPEEFAQIAVLSRDALQVSGTDASMGTPAMAAILFTKLRRKHQDWGLEYFEVIREMVVQLEQGKGVTLG